jgi:pimeloyl-ACP methyl ester carboxylesterase
VPSWEEPLARYAPNREVVLAQDSKEFMATMERWMAAYCSCAGELVPGLPDADVRRLDLPALVFRSGESDPNHPRVTSEQLAALLPNVQLVEPPWPDTEWIDRGRGLWQGFERWPLLAPQLTAWAETALV